MIFPLATTWAVYLNHKSIKSSDIPGQGSSLGSQFVVEEVSCGGLSLAYRKSECRGLEGGRAMIS